MKSKRIAAICLCITILTAGCAQIDTYKEQGTNREEYQDTVALVTDPYGPLLKNCAATNAGIMSSCFPQMGQQITSCTPISPQRSESICAIRQTVHTIMTAVRVGVLILPVEVICLPVWMGKSCIMYSAAPKMAQPPMGHPPVKYL